MSAQTGEQGVASVVLPMMVWVATLVGIATIDLGAYLVAAARAQQVADAAALAAVATELPEARTSSPRAAADGVVRSRDAVLERCDCRRGRTPMQVEVSVAVPGLVLPQLGASRVRAVAEAILAPPADLAPGPTRERARWLPAQPP